MASIQKLIERLEAKGCVRRDRSQRAHRFRPLVSHEQFLRSRLQALADRLCEGALVPLVTTLLRSGRVPKKEREALHQLVDSLWPAKGSGNRTSD
jgi:predicted transcriptional regulator